MRERETKPEPEKLLLVFQFEMDKKIVNLIQCGKRGDSKELQQFVESFDVDEVSKNLEWAKFWALQS